MKILASMLIVIGLAGGCARHTVVYEPAASPAYVVTSPAVPTTTYVVRYDNRDTCRAAGGRWHSRTQSCTF